MKKTYTLVLDYDGRGFNSGWLSVTRYGHKVMKPVRFNNYPELEAMFTNTKSDLITQGATHFKTIIR